MAGTKDPSGLLAPVGMIDGSAGCGPGISRISHPLGSGPPVMVVIHESS
jgi:hypothetical protein